MSASIQSTPRIFLGCPAYGQVMMTATASSLLATQRVLQANNMDGGFGTLSYPDIVEIRDIFLSLWFDKIQTSHLLFVDNDMNWDPQLVIDMVSFSMSHDKPLLGALCPKKKLPIEFAGRAKQGDVQVVNGHMEVNGVGGALMLIRRDCVETMLKKMPELSDEITVKNHAAKDILEAQGVKRMIRAFDPVFINGEKFSEDLSFCHRWLQCGGDIWANIAHKIGHVGLYEFSGCYFDTIKEHIRQTPAPETPKDEFVPSLVAAE